MASVYDMFSASEKAAETGKWFEIGDTIKVKVRRFKSKKSREVRDALEAPYKRLTKFGGAIPDEALERITTEHIAAGIVADWKGVTDREGNALAYSKAAAVQLFNDLPEFRDAIVAISLDIENYRDEEKEEVEGN